MSSSSSLLTTIYQIFFSDLKSLTVVYREKNGSFHILTVCVCQRKKKNFSIHIRQIWSRYLTEKINLQPTNRLNHFFCLNFTNNQRNVFYVCVWIINNDLKKKLIVVWINKSIDHNFRLFRFDNHHLFIYLLSSIIILNVTYWLIDWLSYILIKIYNQFII